MGLRIYDDPEEKDDVKVTAAKLDRVAAQRRSTIRREPSIRPGRDQSTSSGLTNIIRSRHEMLRARHRLQLEAEQADREITLLEEQLTRLRRQRTRHRVRLMSDTRDALETDRDDSNHQSSNIINDITLTSEPAEISSELSGDVLLPRPARESNLRFEQSATADAIRADVIPSPPNSSSERPASRPVDGPLDSWETTPSLSTTFAPARRALTETSAGRDSTYANPGIETPPESDTADNLGDEYPPLRRMPRMSPRPVSRNRTRSRSNVLSTADLTVRDLDALLRGIDENNLDLQESTWQNLMERMRDLEDVIDLDPVNSSTTGNDNNNNNENASDSTTTSFASDIAPDHDNGTRSSSRNTQTTNMTSNTSMSFGEISHIDNTDTCDLPPGISPLEARLIRDRHTLGPVNIPSDIMQEFIRPLNQPRLADAAARSVVCADNERCNEWGEFERFSLLDGRSTNFSILAQNPERISISSRRRAIEDSRYDVYSTPSVVDIDPRSVRVVAHRAGENGHRLEEGIFRAIRWRITMGWAVPGHWWRRLGLDINNRPQVQV